MKQQFSNYFILLLSFAVSFCFGMQQYELSSSKKEKGSREEYLPIIPKEDVGVHYLSPQIKRRSMDLIPEEVSKKSKNKKKQLILDRDDLEDILGNTKHQSQFLTWFVLHTFSKMLDKIPVFESHTILITAEKMLKEDEENKEGDLINPVLKNFRKILVTHGIAASASEMGDFLNQKSVCAEKERFLQTILKGRIKKNYGTAFSKQERKQMAESIKGCDKNFLPLLIQFFWESNYGQASKLRRAIDEFTQKDEQQKLIITALDKHQSQLFQETIKNTIFPFSCIFGLILMIKVLPKLKKQFPELFKSIENLLFLTFLKHETWSQQPLFVMRGTKLNGETELLQMPITVRVS